MCESSCLIQTENKLNPMASLAGLENAEKIQKLLLLKAKGRSMGGKVY